MTLKVVADENMPGLEQLLGPACQVTRLPGRSMTAGDLQDADALLVRSVTRVDRALLDGTLVRFVGTATSGFDHIDRSYLAERGIPFSHAPGANANSVVEYVLAAVAATEDFLQRLLAGGCVGIVGYGHVGKALAARLQALGIPYRVSDPWLAQDTVSNAASLESILQCDVICLHPELTREEPWPSYHLLDEGRLNGLCGSQLLINASRGPVVDNRALRKVLAAGRGPVTVLDVWEGEPAIDRELLQLVDIGTAHIAGYSLDSKWLASRRVCQALAAAFGLEQGRESAGDGPQATLHCADDDDTPELLRRLLGLHYDIRRDDQLLRSLGDDNGAGFDRLRRDYGERRELCGTRLPAAVFKPAQRSIAQALGCILEED